jgi:hypothetical protein
MRIKHFITVGILLAVIASLPAQTASSLPVQEYDYHIPANNVSPITLGMGGINLTNAADYFASYDNPALLADNEGTAFAASFRLKNKENMTFTELMSASNLLKDKQFMYYTLIAKNTAWTYQPVSSINVSERYSEAGNNYSRYYDYQLDKLQLSLAAKDENYTHLAGGLNLKYLTGRLVYLKEKLVGGYLRREEFVDNKVKGISGDLGFTWQEEKITWGVCVYDFYSRLWWESYDSESLQRRAAIGFQYNMDNLALMGSVQGKIAKTSETTYHFGLVRNWTWNAGSSADQQGPVQNLIIRTGLFSKDFNGTRNINYTLGSGYNYNMFRVDFALTNDGMQLSDSQYLFSIGVGIQ